MHLNLEDYRNKIVGCWMGKNIGGTLGAPMEWHRQVNHVTFYQQDPQGQALPNDDLDIQLLWLIALEEKGLNLNAQILADYFLRYVTHNAGEYGNCKANMRAGLLPPICGTYRNPFKDSCGAFIRSEIWACIAPGYPELAAKYAFEDAIIDHGDGEGVYGAVFCAAIESAAFIVTDIPKLIDIGLSYVPEDCGMALAVKSVIADYDAGKDWLTARNNLIENHSGYTHGWYRISPEDKAKGYGEGKVGWDIPSNIGIIILGLLYGQGDFGKTICTIVNCGEDTDCTAATYGSLFGIMYGIEALPKKWTEPIGRSIKTISLDIAGLGAMNPRIPATIDDLSTRVEKIALMADVLRKTPLPISKYLPTDLSSLNEQSLYATDSFSCIYETMKGTLFEFDQFNVFVDYCGDPVISDTVPKSIKVKLINKGEQQYLDIRWYGPEPFVITPHRSGKICTMNFFMNEKHTLLDFSISMDKVPDSAVRFVLELITQNSPKPLHIPIILLNGNVHKSH